VGTAEAAWLGYKARSFELLRLAEGDHVLDVGCGTGEDARAIAGRVAGVSVTGVDASDDKIREARARTLGCRGRWSSASATPTRRRSRTRHSMPAGPIASSTTRWIASALVEMARDASGRPDRGSDTDYDSWSEAADQSHAPDSPAPRRSLECGRVGRSPRAVPGCGLTSVAVTPYAAVSTSTTRRCWLRDKADRRGGGRSRADRAMGRAGRGGRAGRFGRPAA
jgi:hypothetical protein